eukprot:gnl/MRDRNA2_/MRDRNA2_17653_c0_seq1.p1 gnl/MRDRNA2_/MRDRNA2_17653_c0~~gnl/MRDRNA2_/MRDRNA2_17653_c0_seq1.p1  ORF type:complete len:298 (+),score=17.53 gnl/MRDRNA2_/MRDRNA2_17653_c0_seq1:126-896(+)
MPTPRGALGAAHANGCIYAIGGCDAIGFHDDACPIAEVFDLKHNVWSAIPRMRIPRSSLAVVELRGHIYAIGGCRTIARQNGSTSRSQVAFESCDSGHHAWNRLPNLPSDRCSCAAVAVQDHIIVVGGCRRRSGRRWSEGPPQMLTSTGRDWSLADVDMYDPNTRIWSHLPCLSHARHSHGVGVSADHQVLVFGGSKQIDKTHSQNMSSIELYEARTRQGQFSLVASHEVERQGISNVWTGGKFAAISGLQGKQIF